MGHRPVAKAKTFQNDSNSNTGGRPRGPWAEKAWRDAIRMAVLRKAEDGGKKLDKLADALVASGLSGDVSALREIGDRLDGKVPQALVGGGADDPAIQVVQRVELVDLT